MVSDLKTFAYKGCKIAAIFFFYFFFLANFALLARLSASVERCFVSRMRDFLCGVSRTDLFYRFVTRRSWRSTCSEICVLPWGILVALEKGIFSPLALSGTALQTPLSIMYSLKDWVRVFSICLYDRKLGWPLGHTYKSLNFQKK